MANITIVNSEIETLKLSIGLSPVTVAGQAQHPSKTFEFDYVFTSANDNFEVYELMKSVVEASLNGRRNDGRLQRDREVTWYVDGARRHRSFCRPANARLGRSDDL